MPADQRRPLRQRACHGGRGGDQVDRRASGLDVVAEIALAPLAQRSASRNGSSGATRNARTSRRSKRAWTQKAAIRGCAASSTTTPSASRASRRAILEPPRRLASEGSRRSRLLKEVTPWRISKAWALPSIAFDRVSYRREDPAEVARLRARDGRPRRPDRRATCRCCASGERGLDALFPIGEIAALGGREGRSAARPRSPPARRFSPRLLPDEAVEQRADSSDGFLDRRMLVVPGRDDLKLVDLRSIALGGLVPHDQAAMLAAAKALMHWHAHHRFCSNCGARNRGRGGGLAAGLPGLQGDRISRAPIRSSSCWRSTATPACSAASRGSRRACTRRWPDSSSRERRSRPRSGARSARKRASPAARSSISPRSRGLSRRR